MANVVKNELTLALDGEISPQAFAEACAAFAELLDALVEEHAQGAQLRWVVTDLHHGSGNETAQCRALDVRDERYVSKVIAGGRRFAEDAELDRPSRERSPRFREVRERFRLLPNDRLTRVRLETPDGDYIVAGLARAGSVPLALRPAAFGSVTGRVQAMSNRGSLRFTLYDLSDDKAISCYLAEDAEQEMVTLWGKTVEVEGSIRRDPETDRPLTVRGITHIAIKDREGTWREALGSAPGFLGDERSEDVIRRVRDA